MKIILNGRQEEIQETTLQSLAKVRCQGAVTIYNGFQTDQDLLLHEGDHVALIQKGVMPSQDELEALMSARHTPGVFEKVKKARVAVAGLGGLGSNIAVQLARTGVGHLHLVDFDVVEPSNLNRQMYLVSHLGRYKTEALAEEISQINPYIQVKIDTLRVTEDNAMDLFSSEDIVCEAFDNPVAKAMLINTLLEKWPKGRIVAASGMAGYESSNTIVTRRAGSRLYLCGDGVSEAKPGMGLMAPRVSICAGHQANMVLRLIVGEYEI